MQGFGGVLGKHVRAALGLQVNGDGVCALRAFNVHAPIHTTEPENGREAMTPRVLGLPAAKGFEPPQG